MGSTLSLLKTLVIPALISLILYLFISYLAVPAWKRYRDRYSHYLPLDTISTRTSSLRQRAHGVLLRFLFPAYLRSALRRDQYSASAQEDAGSDFDDDDGEELYDVDANRRETLSLEERRGRDDGRRLSRDLEEGFKDDSEDEDEMSDHRQS